MRRFLISALACVLAACVLAVSPALAAPTLLLEVWLAGQKGDVVEADAQDGHLYVSQADFAALHLTLSAQPQGGRVDLMHVPGLKVKVDQANQRLELEAEAAALPRQSFDLRPQPASPPDSSAATGAILHYSLSSMVDDFRKIGRTTAAGGDFSLDAFTPFAVFHNAGFAMANSDGLHGVRLDSQLLFDREESMTHIAVGDSISVTPDWGRSVRFAGIQYATDFALRPGLVTEPLPSFFGQSAVPATVDVFNGAVQVYQQQVNAGPFSLHNLPVVTGGGTATIVTTDVLGRQTSQTISLFTDPGMLAPGLESFAVDAGFLRRNYGLDSFNYRDAIASGTWRRGLTDWMTVQAHGEASAKLGLLGGGAEWSLGIGTLSADLAASHSRAGDGTLLSTSAQALQGPLSAYVRAQFSSREFRDLGSLDSGAPLPRSRYQLGANLDLRPLLGGGGKIGVSWLESRNQGRPANRFLTASWSMDMPNGTFVSLTALRDATNHSFGAQFALSIPMDGIGMGGVSADLAGRSFDTSLLYNQPANPNGGWGWRGQMGTQNDGHASAGGTYIGQEVALDGTVATRSGQSGVQATADGALVFLQGKVFATHDPGNAVALIQTGQKDVRVYVENRLAGRSDTKGEVLVTGLNPYAPNHISVDPRDFPFDTTIDKTDLDIVPRQRSGAVASLKGEVHRPQAVQVTMGDKPPPVGSLVRFDDDATPLVIGYDGKFMVQDLRAARTATVTVGGRACRITIRPDLTAPLLCAPEIMEARNAP